MIQRIEPGARLSEAVIHGGKVYLCGAVACILAAVEGV